MTAKRRGFEGALDMLRSLGVILIVVIPFALFFGHTSAHDTKRIRPVDPTEALADFHAETGAPTPTAPAGWVVNVAVGSPGNVRIGYVLGDHYTEFAGGSGPTFVQDEAGKGSNTGQETVGGVTWSDYLSADGHHSLVRRFHGVLLVVGGIREDVTAAQLRELAATVR